MKKNKNNEELQSRREFFKNAAKGALPILGAIMLANSPIIARSTVRESLNCESSCESSCSGRCQGGCSGSCSGACTGCKGSCSGSCTATSH